MVFDFKSGVKWVQGVIGKTTVGDVVELEFALPKEFGGEEGYVKPQELLMSSLLTCFSATLWRLLREKGVELKGYAADVVGSVNKDEEGYNSFLEAVISVKILLANEIDRLKVERALELSEKYCPVGRAIRGNMKLKFEVSITA